MRPGRHGKRFRPGDLKKPCRPLTGREILVTDRGKKIDRQIAISLRIIPIGYSMLVDRQENYFFIFLLVFSIFLSVW